MLDVEVQIVKFIQQHRLEELDSFLLFLTSSTTAISIILALTFCWAIYREKMDDQSVFYPFSIFFVLSLASLFSFGLKLFVSRARPFNSSIEILQLAPANTFSFPSGHTTAVCAILFGLVFFLPKKRFIIPVFIWAILVMYSRLAFGVHFITDILAGILLSFMTAFACKKYGERYIQRKPKDISK